VIANSKQRSPAKVPGFFVWTFRGDYRGEVTSGIYSPTLCEKAAKDGAPEW